MHELLVTIGEGGLVPVIRLESASAAVPLARALAAGGIPVAEVTFRTAAAGEAIRAMTAEVPDVIVGTGTIVKKEQARIALEAGARFIVSPGFNPEIVEYCQGRGVPVLPGVNGPEGVERGVAMGLSMLKFFPAEASGGVAMLDSLAGPYADMMFVPTGGIDLANLAGYARRPNVAAVGGSWMVKPAVVEAGDWAGIERLCREAVLALHGFSFAHLGINGSDEEDSREMSARLASLFGFPVKEGASSAFASEGIEITKKPFLGRKGHIAIRCNNVERAIARFKRMGVASLPDTAKKEKDRIKAIYLDLEVGGFALHLLRA